MIRSVSALVTIAVVLALTNGCRSYVDQHMGEAQRANRQAQVAHPDAGGGPGPQGLDAITAEKVIEGYQGDLDRETQQDTSEIFLLKQ